VLENPIQIKSILTSLSEQLGKIVTKDILKRFLKKLRYSYRRIRQWVKGKPDPILYERKVQELKALIELEQNEFLTIYYGDESGFSTTPCVPYGWQLIDEPMTIPTERSKRRNVFGLMSLSGDLWTYSPKKKMDSAFIIASINDFVQKRPLNGRTIIVLDNATIHQSELFKAQIPLWEENDVFIFHLPTYSPHLNPIEIFWRKCKYEWLLPQHFESFQTVNERLDYIFEHFGSEFKIQWKNAA
jgi:transposase